MMEKMIPLSVIPHRDYAGTAFLSWRGCSACQPVTFPNLNAGKF